MARTAIATKAAPARPARAARPGSAREFERLFFRLTAAFARAPDVAVDAVIASWLRRLVRFLGVDLGGVAQVLADGRTVQLTHACGLRRSLPRPGTVLDTVYPWFAEQIRMGKTIQFDRGRLARSSEKGLRCAPGRRPASYLLLPLRAGGTNLGALTLANCRRRRRWPQELVRRLQLVAQVFGAALARRHARERLQARLTFERMITRLVKTFVDVAAEEIGEKVDEGLGRLCDCLGLEEAILARASDEGALRIVHRAGRAAASRASFILGVPRYDEALRARQIAVASSPTDVAFLELDGAAAEAALLRDTVDGAVRSWSSQPSPRVDHSQKPESPRPRAHVSIPLVEDTRLWGSITAVARYSLRVWTVWEIQQLRLVGEILMGALARREIEDKIQRQRDDLMRMTRVTALGVLTAALAHELTQPLTAIRTNAQTTRRLLAAGGDLDQLDEIFADIAGDGARAASLITRLRNLLRRHELDKIYLDVNQIIEEARARASEEAERRGARLVLVLAPELPKVQGDPVQLQQVVLNLVRNAAEAMADRVAAPEVVLRTRATDVDDVTVSVEDTGPSIDDASFEKMFVAFHTTKREGLGMGLAISRSIVEAHGGRLWAERRPEPGLVVGFTLPVGSRL